MSIADLGGTEIDLRFASPKEGRLFVIVAPVRRFADGELPRTLLVTGCVLPLVVAYLDS